ncbi:PAS domain S-box-containing protein [Inhella inkyongensis]|uniref:histidine kinase n=1 Tax=Inhella inkyongensis TaxID=392593 RepID=A0A840S599_9BURK|nr:ATP-binding protein [Inhella inkyongensis]MBB5204742.1 PAS domain S-box-containing protein [Inhella inkyongensis]
MLLTLVFGLGVSALGHGSMRDAEALRQQERSSAAAREIVSQVERELTRTVEAVRNAGLMVQSHDQLPRGSFVRYAQQLAVALPPISLLEWQPVVQQADRETFEREARAQGLAHYRIVEPDASQTQWSPAPVRDHYVPVLFAWPEADAPLGYNLAPDAMRMASKLQSARLGRPVASVSFPLIKRAIQGPAIKGFAISTAVKAHGPDAPEAVRGYLAAVIELPALLQAVGEQAQRAHMNLWVFEGDEPRGALLYTNRPAQQPATTGAALTLERRHTVNVAERSWSLLLQPQDAFLGRADRQAQGLLVLGLLATALLTYALWRAQRERAAAHASQETMRGERERLANVLDGTQAATWEADLIHRVYHVNTQWQRLGGHEPGSYRPGPDYHWEQDCHPEDIPRVRQALERHFKGEAERYEIEYRHRHLTRGWVWAQARGRLLARTPEGLPWIMAGTLLDIDARKAAEARILELNSTLEARVAERGAELERALEALRESREELAHADTRATLHTVMASAAHELQTPLGNSLICTQNLVDQTREFEGRLAAGDLRRSELRHFVDQVGDNASLAARNLARAAELVDRFRQVAADQGSEQRRVFDLATLVEELIDTLAPTQRRLPHRVECAIAPGIAMDSYPGPLGQVLINLINNANLHAFGPEQAGLLRIEAQPEADGVLMTVRDNGRGMDATTLKRLFEPYFSTRIGAGGTGLGMTIVDTLVRKTLGGQLAVHSEVGVGTVVTLRLPRRAPERPASNPAAS